VGHPLVFINTFYAKLSNVRPSEIVGKSYLTAHEDCLLNEAIDSSISDVISTRSICIKQLEWKINSLGLRNLVGFKPVCEKNGDIHYVIIVFRGIFL
jgi:hypothetical protein